MRLSLRFCGSMAVLTAAFAGCSSNVSNPPPPEKAIDSAMIQDKMRESFQKGAQSGPPQQRELMEKQLKKMVPSDYPGAPGGATPKKE